MTLRIESTAFREGGRIPTRYTCDGEDESPPLAWSGAPKDTRSFVLLCDDPDAPAGTWHHWALFNMPAQTSRLDAAYSTDETVGVTRQAVNDFGSPGYGGPCPPQHHGVHHYRFRLLALSAERLDLASGAACSEVESAARSHALAETALVGTYSR